MQSTEKTVILTILLILLQSATIAWSAATPEHGSDILILDSLSNLYGPVTFNHALHQEMLSCTRCHHHTTGDEAGDTRCSSCHASAANVKTVRCSDCHLSADARPKQPLTDDTAPKHYHIDTPGLKGALHLQCLTCHREQGGPVGCQDCHALTAAGETFYFTRIHP